MSVADLALACGEWDEEALATHPVSAFTDHVRSSRLRLWDFFKVIDARTNAHGRLSDADMVLALKEMGIPLSDDQIDDLVGQMEHEKPDGKITFASLKRTMEHHRVSVLLPLRKERESWINHPMRKYSITTGHRKHKVTVGDPREISVVDDGDNDDEVFFGSDEGMASGEVMVAPHAQGDTGVPRDGSRGSDRLSPNARVSGESSRRTLRRSTLV